MSPLKDPAERATRPPGKAENDSWWSYRAICLTQGREPDERTFRDAWRLGCSFTFGATSSLAPSLETFSRWLDYVTSWSAPLAPDCHYCDAAHGEPHDYDRPHFAADAAAETTEPTRA